MSDIIPNRRWIGVAVALLVLSSIPSTVAAQESAAWVLAETNVNPGGETFPYGSETGEITGQPVEGRYEGTAISYDISPTSMTYHYRSVYDGVEYFDATWVVQIESPPNRLIPGETVELSATSTGSGSVGDEVGVCSAGTQFEFRADGVGLSGTTQQRTCLDFDGGTTTPTFVVPEVREGGEIRITAFLWNCGACDVEWVYRPSGTGSGEGETPTTTPEDCRWESVSRDREQIGTLVGVVDTVELAVAGCDQWTNAERGMPIYKDDVIRTGHRGQARLELLPHPVTGGRAVTSIGPDTVLATEPLRHPEYSYWELFTGRFHYWTENWGRQSIFSVKAGTPVMGVRGSEVLIVYDADAEHVDVYVKEGVVNVTDESTEAVTQVEAGQRVEIATSGFGTVASLTTDEWDAAVEASGLDDPASDGKEWDPSDSSRDGGSTGESAAQTDGSDDQEVTSTTDGPPLDGFTAVFAVLSVLSFLALSLLRGRRSGRFG